MNSRHLLLVLFSQAYNCNPKCAPARACLLTGRYWWQLESACNYNPFMPEKWKFYPFLRNLAGQSKYRDTCDSLWDQLHRELAAQGDPRVRGGDIFDAYPNGRIDRQQKLYGHPDYDPVKSFEDRFGDSK